MDVEAIRARIEQRAKEAAVDDETATVAIGQAPGVNAWEIRVAWLQHDQEIEEMLQRGTDLQRMENETIGRIGVRNPQRVYYFRAERALFGEGADSVAVCHPGHRHKTHKEAEACESGGDLPHIIRLVCATQA